jgi:hypothetical protein
MRDKYGRLILPKIEEPATKSSQLTGEKDAADIFDDDFDDSLLDNVKLDDVDLGDWDGMDSVEQEGGTKSKKRKANDDDEDDVQDEKYDEALEMYEQMTGAKKAKKAAREKAVQELKTSLRDNRYIFAFNPFKIILF